MAVIEPFAIMASEGVVDYKNHMRTDIEITILHRFINQDRGVLLCDLLILVNIINTKLI